MFLLLHNNCWSQSISPGDTTICQNSQAVLTANPAGTSYQWRFNSANIAGATARTYTATKAGSYDVVVTTAGNPVTYPAITVSVNPKPVANFTFVQPSVCSKDAVQFTSTSTGTGLTYLWDFGDPNSGANNSSALQNPVHRFIGANGGGPQSFSVKLNVTNNFVCDSSIVKTISFQQPGSQLGGTFTSCSGISPATLTFINQSNTNNTRYEFFWGDGQSPATFSPPFISTTHTYSTGDYTLNFVVTGANGCVDTGVYRVFIGKIPGGSIINPGETNICIGESLTFPILGTESNSPGTTYSITFSDSPSVVIKFSHPPPASITHTFARSSCGSNSPNYNNSFYAKMITSNPCFSNTSVAEPIYVSNKPSAAFTMSPKDTICVNTTVTLTNTSLGNTISSQACATNKIVWKINPFPGRSIDCGSQGSDNLDPFNPNLWVSGSNTFCLKYTTPGLDTILLKTGGSCKGNQTVLDSVKKTICVNPVPTASFTTSKDSGCAPLSIIIQTTTNTPFCGSYKYKWTVTYSNPNSCLPSGRNFRYINNTDSTFREPSIEFLNPGNYVLGLVVISPGGTCSTAVISKTIKVKGKPNVSFNASAIPSSICQNKCLKPDAVYNCYIDSSTTYSWSFAGGSPASSTKAKPDSVCFNTPGTYSISLKVTNECGDITISKQITVNAAPIIAGSSSTNPGSCGTSTGSITLNGLIPNTTYSVSYTKNGGTSGPLTIKSDSNGNITITGLSSGTYTNITVTLNSCTSTAVGPITLNDPNPPPTPTARSNSPICVGETLMLFTDTVTGAVYSWTGPSFTSASQNPTRPNATTAMSGTYSVTIKLNGCTSAPGTVTVVVRPKPEKPVVCTSPISYCFNDVASPLCAQSSSQNSLRWCTNYPQNCSANAPAPRTDTVGTLCYAVYQQSDTSGCKSDTAKICITISPKITNNIIKSDQTFCSTNAVPDTLKQASGKIGGGNGSYLYKWEKSTDGGATWDSVGRDSTYFPTSIPGKFRRIVNGSACTDISNIVTISIGGFGNDSIAASQNICAGTVPNKLTGSYPTGGNGNFTFEWQSAASITGPWSRTSGVFNQQDYQPPALNITTYYRRKDSSAGCFAYTPTVTITVYEKPLAGIIRPDTSVCAGSSVTVYAGSVKGTIKSWQSHKLPLNASPWTDNPDINKNIIFNNVKDSFAVRLIVLSDGFGKGCDVADTSNTIFINVSQNAVGGNTDVDATVCSGSNAGVITLSNFTGQIVRWDSSINNGASWAPVANTTSSFPYKNLNTTTWYRAVVKNGACPEVFSDTTIITVVKAVTPANAGADQYFCHVNSIILFGNTPAVGNGTWSQTVGPNNAAVTNPSLPNTSVTGLVDGTYKFAWTIGSSNGGQCAGSSDTVAVIIWPLTTQALAGNDTIICDFASVKIISLHANQPRSFETGSWRILSGPGGSFSNSVNPNSTFNVTQAGIYQIIWRISNDSLNGCPANEDTMTVYVYEKPLAGSITPASSTICAGDSIALSYASVNGMILKWQYNFTPSNAATWLDVNSTALQITFRNVQQSFAVRVLVIMPGNVQGCSVADTSNAAIVNVNPKPPVVIKVLPSLVLQQSDYTFTFSETSASSTNYSYLWSMGDKSLQTRSGKEITYTYPDTGTYKVKLLVTDFSTDCKGLDSVTVKILYIPGYLYIPNAMCVGCSNNSLRQFLPLGKGLKQYRLRIFSKWGKLLFETTSLAADGSPNEPWHADFSNTQLQQDSFMWIVEAKFINGLEWKGMQYPGNPHYVKSGFITVIK